MHKVEYKDAQKSGGDKEKKKRLGPRQVQKKSCDWLCCQKGSCYLGDSSSESDELENIEDASMMTMEDDENAFYPLFSLKNQKMWERRSNTSQR